MKFALAISTLLSVASLALGASVPTRRAGPTVPTSQDCVSAYKYVGTYNGGYSQKCGDLAYACMAAANTTDYIWHKSACVASAACTGPGNTVTLAKCSRVPANETFPNRPDTSSLSYNVYANIVGDCAYDEGGCPITTQKFVDWIYGVMNNLNTSNPFPNYNEVVNNWWTPITEWTKTGDTVPYTNFNDWLHYGPNLGI